jgi:hypothetical protein
MSVYWLKASRRKTQSDIHERRDREDHTSERARARSRERERESERVRGREGERARGREVERPKEIETPGPRERKVCETELRCKAENLDIVLMEP